MGMYHLNIWWMVASTYTIGNIYTNAFIFISPATNNHTIIMFLVYVVDVLYPKPRYNNNIAPSILAYEPNGQILFSRTPVEIGCLRKVLLDIIRYSKGW